MMVIQTSKIDLISRIYQIMVVSILNTLNCKYSSYYFNKFIGFILIYYAINLDIVFSYLYRGFIDLL